MSSKDSREPCLAFPKNKVSIYLIKHFTKYGHGMLITTNNITRKLLEISLISLVYVANPLHYCALKLLYFTHFPKGRT